MKKSNQQQTTFKKSNQQHPIKLDLEEVMTQKNVILRFISYLVEHHCAENMKFWLEAQIYKYEKDQEKIKVAAQEIYNKYWGIDSCGLNIEEDHLILELKQKVKRPDRTIFMLVQNAIWGLLKLECYPRFCFSDGAADKIKKKKLKGLNKIPEAKEIIDLYDKFLELNEQYPILPKFRATVLPNDAYNEHLHTALPDIDELWKDKDLMLAFREYLYHQYAHENLSYFVEASNFEFLKDRNEIEKRSKEIFDKFIGPNASHLINLDYVVVNKIKNNLKHPTNEIFKSITVKIWKVLKNEWFPDFIVSPHYIACNDETIEYVKSDGGRKRSRTLDEYELLCTRKFPHDGTEASEDHGNNIENL